jgi:hypothetical protein
MTTRRGAGQAERAEAPYFLVKDTSKTSSRSTGGGAAAFTAFARCCAPGEVVWVGGVGLGKDVLERLVAVDRQFAAKRAGGDLKLL